MFSNQSTQFKNVCLYLFDTSFLNDLNKIKKKCNKEDVDRYEKGNKNIAGIRNIKKSNVEITKRKKENARRCHRRSLFSFSRACPAGTCATDQNAWIRFSPKMDCSSPKAQVYLS